MNGALPKCDQGHCAPVAALDERVRGSERRIFDRLGALLEKFNGMCTNVGNIRTDVTEIKTALARRDGVAQGRREALSVAGKVLPWLWKALIFVAGAAAAYGLFVAGG